MTELLKCENLTKKYGNLTALNQINLTVTDGKIIGLLGPNGSGKTTLIKLLNGLLQPTQGNIFVCGSKPGTLSKSKVSYLPDSSFLNNWMSVEQIVDFFDEFYSDFSKEAAYQMLAKLQIEPKAKLKTLSKGNKEKVSLILVMSRKALLYVLDEPIAGVDPATRDFIIKTILNNYNPKASVLISTHLISDIEEVLDEAIFINKGNIVLHKTVDEIREENGKSVDELFREVFKW